MINPDNMNLYKNLFKQSKYKKNISDYNINSNLKNFIDIINFIISNAKRINKEILIIDLTRLEINIPVVKVVIPNSQPAMGIDIRCTDRITEIPKLMNWEDYRYEV